ncbi:MAG: hypothetical protein ACYDAZ_03900 [Thermoplasmataceae archaeon]
MSKTLGILLIVIAMIMPIQLLDHNYNASPVITTDIVSSSEYNFSTVPVSTFPANNSWISFSIQNRTSVSASVQKGIGRNGLNVAIDSATVDSGLWANMTLPQNSTVTVTFSWNNNLSHSMAAESISTYFNGTQQGNISFGPPLAYCTHLYDRTGNYNLGTQPGYNTVESLNEYPSTGGNGSLIFNISGGSGNMFPQVMSCNRGYSGNVELLFGGTYSNITIYSISVSGEVPPFYPVSLGELPYRQITDPNLPQYSAQNSGYIQDMAANSLIYAGKNGSIRSLNYYNGTDSVLSSSAQNLSVLCSWGSVDGNAIYISYGNATSIKFYNVSATTLEASYAGELRFNTSSASVFRWDNLVVLLQQDLNMTAFAMQGGALEETWNTSLSRGAGTGLLYASADNGIMTTVVMQNQQIYLQDFAMINGNVQEARSWQGNGISSSCPPSYYNNTIHTLWKTVTGTQIMFNGTGYETVSREPGVINSISSDSRGFTISGPSSAYSGNASSITQLTSPGSGGLFVPDGNETFLMITGGSCYLIGHSFDYSKHTISFTSPGNLTLRGNETLALNVTSSLPYSDSLALGGETFRSENSSIMITSSSLIDGTYNSAIMVENVAGYSTERNITVYVDNHGPMIVVKPGNFSYIPDNATLNFSSTSIFGISSITFTYFNRTATCLTPTGNIQLSTGSYSGLLDLNVTASDRLGVHTYEQFVFHVISGNRSGFQIDLNNNSYLNSTHQMLMWSQINGTDTYVIEVRGKTIEYIYSTTPQTEIILPEGDSSIIIESELLDGITEKLCNVSVDVISYAPDLVYNNSSERFYSFFGNSANNTFYLNASTNITSMITVDVFNPEGLNIADFSGRDRVQAFLGWKMPGMVENGQYRLVINATSLSGTSISRTMDILVNNTVPPAPFVRFTSYSRNGSLLIPWSEISGMRYSASWVSATGSGDHSGFVRTLNESTQGTYNVTASYFTQSGNFNSSAITSYYYNVSPDIASLVFPGTVENSSGMVVCYTISDPVPVIHVTLNCSSLGLNTSRTASSGKIPVSFNRNGIYLFNLSAVDGCGNSVTVHLNVSVVYFIAINSSSIVGSVFGNEGKFTLSLSGEIGHSPGIRWYINGRYSGNGSSVQGSLNYGDNVVKAVLSFNGHSITDTYRTFCVGFVPEALLGLSAMAYSGYWIISRNDDPEGARAVVASMKGYGIREIYRKARKEKYRRKQVRGAIGELIESGECHIGTALSGKPYLMPSNRERTDVGLHGESVGRPGRRKT